MSWIGVGVGAGVLTSTLNSKAQRKAQERQADISAAQMQYSPWTGVTPQAFNPQPVGGAGDALAAGAAGGLSAAMQKQANANSAANSDLVKAQADYYKGITPGMNPATPAQLPGMPPMEQSWGMQKKPTFTGG